MKLQIPETLMISEVDNELVILNTETEQFYGLNESAADMWTALKETDSVEAAVAHMVEQYDVSTDQVRQDMENLIKQLVEWNLIVIEE